MQTWLEFLCSGAVFRLLRETGNYLLGGGGAGMVVYFLWGQTFGVADLVLEWCFGRGS